MSASTDTPRWAWIVLRNALTLAYCAVGAGLLWPVRVGGVQLPAIAWIGVVVTIHILLIRFQRQPWPGLSVLTRSSASGRGPTDRNQGHQSGSVRFLMLADDLLPIALLCWALFAGAVNSKGLMHYVLVGCLLLLIGCSFAVNSRLHLDEIDDVRRESERLPNGSMASHVQKKLSPEGEGSKLPKVRQG